MQHFLVTGMNKTHRTEEIEKIRKNLKLELTFQPHRCEWCDFIKDVKDNRKRKQKKEKETLWRTHPFKIKNNE